MGFEYEKAMRACLSGDLAIIRDDIYQSQFARAFETVVLARLSHGIEVDGEPSALFI